MTKEKNILFGPLRPRALKYALVSIIRNSGRSLIIPLLALTLSVVLVFLTFISSSQEEKRATVYDRIPVNAYITTFKNETRDLGDLNLQYDIYRLIDPEYDNRMGMSRTVYEDYQIYGEYSSLQAREERNKLLEDSEFFQDMYLYSGLFYEYMGVAKTKDGLENEELSDFPHIRNHSLIEGYDWFLEAIIRMPRLAYADDIRYTPDFFGDPSARVEFLEGYSYDSLKLPENIGMIGDKFAANKGIELGDTIRITAWFTYDDDAVCCLLDLKVVGIYEQTWRSDVIYLPWNMSYDHNYYKDFFFPENHRDIAAERYTGLWNEIIPRSISSATFTLKNTEKLDSFRDYLKSLNYSEAGNIKSNRRAVVIQDKNLMETINTLDNYIRLMDILIPIMLVLFGIIGFMISYLLIRHRLNELAIMRSLGVSKSGVFLSFFIEQLLLFTLGILPVILFGLVFKEYFSFYGAPLGYFVISYLAGTALALVILGRAKLLDILSTSE